MVQGTNESRIKLQKNTFSYGMQKWCMHVNLHITHSQKNSQKLNLETNLVYTTKHLDFCVLILSCQSQMQELKEIK